MIFKIIEGIDVEIPDEYADKVNALLMATRRQYHQMGYEQGHDEGYESGYDVGYQRGYDYGYDVGYDIA